LEGRAAAAAAAAAAEAAAAAAAQPGTNSATNRKNDPAYNDAVTKTKYTTGPHAIVKLTIPKMPQKSRW
jgi:hypothetical protein